MGITIKIGDITIYADGYILNSNDMTIQFYREKSILDYIPPIKVSEDMLSDFGRNVVGVEGTEKAERKRCSRFVRNARTI